MTGKVLYQVNLLSIYRNCVSSIIARRFVIMVVFVFGEDNHPVESIVTILE